MKKKWQQKRKGTHFIDKLQCILSVFDQLNDKNPQFNKIISWDKNGDVIQLYNKEELESTILPLFFKHQQFESFQRQLNKYGFQYLREYRNILAYKHPHFKKNKISKKFISRKRVKQIENIEEYSLEYNQKQLKKQLKSLQIAQAKIRSKFFEAITFYTEIHNSIKDVLRARAKMKFYDLAFVSYFVYGIKSLSSAMKFNEGSPAFLLFKSICQELETNQINLFQNYDSEIDFIQKVLQDVPVSDSEYLQVGKTNSSVHSRFFELEL